jgi:hypothetical protein
MTLSIDRWMHRPRLAAYGDPARDIVMAIRWQVVGTKRGHDAFPALIDRLGGAVRAGRAVHMRLLIAAIWPDSFALSPCCCPHMTHDEALLAALMEAAQCGARADFDTLACDMLSEDARDQLWRECVRF